MANINEVLNEKIPRDAVSKRDGGGIKLDYLETWYVIDRLNRVFGNLGWDSEVIELRELPGEKPSYLAKVRLTVSLHDSNGTLRHVCKEGIGYGSDKSKFNPHELAAKEAESDALKRAAMKFGMSMGLALYDKSKENVDETPKEEPKVEIKRETKGQFDRTKYNSIIRTNFNIATKLKNITLEAAKSHLKDKYKVSEIDALSDSQAKEFCGFLEGLNKPKGENHAETIQG